MRRWAPEAAARNLVGMALAGLTLAACASGPRATPGVATQGQPSPDYGGYKVGKPYQVKGVWYYPKDQPNYDEIGIASWYGAQFHNQNTADGEVFDMNMPSAAHKTLPLPSLVEVTNLANGKTLVVRVNDRGPFVDGRIIDLSKEAAAELGFVASGVTRVRVRYVGRAPDPPGSNAFNPRREFAQARPGAPKAVASKGAAPKPAAPPVDLANATPQRPVPYGQLAQAAPGAVAAASHAAVAAPAAEAYQSFAAAKPPPVPAPAAAPAGPALPDVDSLLAETPAAAASAAIPATYELQAGSFATEDAARRFASGLSGGGLPEVQTVRDGAEVAYRVVVHGLTGPAEAAAARSEAMALGAPKALIVGGS